MSLTCKCTTETEHLLKIYDRYREFCHLEKSSHVSKFLYNYKRHTMNVHLNDSKTLEFDISDFIEWDSISYKDNMCYDAQFRDIN